MHCASKELFCFITYTFALHILAWHPVFLTVFALFAKCWKPSWCVLISTPFVLQFWISFSRLAFVFLRFVFFSYCIHIFDFAGLFSSHISFSRALVIKDMLTSLSNASLMEWELLRQHFAVVLRSVTCWQTWKTCTVLFRIALCSRFLHYKLQHVFLILIWKWEYILHLQCVLCGHMQKQWRLYLSILFHTVHSFQVQNKLFSIYPKCFLTSSQVQREAASSAFCSISEGSLLTLLYFLCNQDNRGKGAISPNFTEESSATSRCPAFSSGRVSLQSVTLL